MIPGRVFFDTNIPLYLFDDRAPRKQKLAGELLAEALQSRRGVVSYQVVQEFLNIATRRFAKPMSASEARVFLRRVLWPMCEVFPDLDLYLEAVSVREEIGWSFYDSLVVSAAARAGCSVLYTEDLQSGRTVRGVEIRDPFA